MGAELQLRPCFFLKILLKAFFFRLLEDSLSSPSSSVGLLLLVGWTPGPLTLPDELDEAEEEKASGRPTTSGAMQRERVEQEELKAPGELPRSSPRLELFSRPPPPPPPLLRGEPWPGRRWSLDDRR